MAQSSVENETKIIKAGFLQKQSMYLKAYRKRWMVLKDSCLYSYKSENINAKPTEIIDINSFNDIKISNNNKKTQFELISGNKNRTKRVFIAASVNEMNDWINQIQNIMHSSPLHSVYLSTYSQLINMGFEDKLSFDAANKFPTNINKAIIYIEQNTNNGSSKIQIQQPKYDKKQINTDETQQSEKLTNIKQKVTTNVIDHRQNLSFKFQNVKHKQFMNCSVETCLSLQRIINLLKYYNGLHDTAKLSQFTLSIMRKYLVNDYHHILEHHLNEDKNSKLSVADQFREI
eukprot:234092_1